MAGCPDHQPTHRTGETDMFKKTALAAVAVLAIAGAAVASDDKPGSSSKGYELGTTKSGPVLSLAEVAKKLEAQGYSNVTEIEFEHGAYEVKARDGKGQRVKLYLDAVTGEPIKGKHRS
jgi:uncharacterized membrane protein YkoI